MSRFHFTRSILYPLLALVILQFACSLGAQSPNPTSQPAGGINSVPTNPPTSVSTNSNGSQVVISGAVSKTYTPVRVYAVSLGQGGTGIYLLDQDSNSVTLSFPADNQPSTYPIEDRLDNSVVGVGAMVDIFGDNAATYFSTKGTLTLTAVGSKFSGQFQFTAADMLDPTKTVEVSGSFTDVPYTP